VSELGHGLRYARHVARVTRRDVLLAGAGLLGGCSPLAYAFPREIEDARFALSASACAPDHATPGGPEGPFYRPRTPRRVYLAEPDGTGERLLLEGRVLDADCRPIEGAVLDFWQADERGEYDRYGQRYRGHQFTARGGLYRILTVKPGIESVLGLTRTPHLHVKAQGPATGLLTTQLYFAEEEARNRADPFFDPATALVIDRTGRFARARFDLVLPR
jgi:protocatechuate 3,4-dioxygenase beta subunit